MTAKGRKKFDKGQIMLKDLLMPVRRWWSILGDDRGMWQVVYPTGEKTYWLPYSQARPLHEIHGGTLLFKGEVREQDGPT